ncbi:hypothetical protein Taro_044734 [Colocasia esculenta]|uniref:Uncharacterized protein n=1 Tax=Colocasia esculenta TaxID=4460 RepID=A0A843WK10_COLES|nr:hypothetical protein [Colocasia esculenta]
MADAFLFGFPSGFGMMVVLVKAFFDATQGLWGTQRLVGKPTVIFFGVPNSMSIARRSQWTVVTQLNFPPNEIISVPISYTFWQWHVQDGGGEGCLALPIWRRHLYEGWLSPTHRFGALTGISPRSVYVTGVGSDIR